MIALVGGTFVDGQDVRDPFHLEARGAGGFVQPYQLQFRGRNRGVENDALRRFEVYAADGIEPTFPESGTVPAVPSGDLVAADTSFPIVVSLADGDWRVVVRQRNGYNVVSENTESERIVIDSGASGPVPPEALLELRASVSGWNVLVEAFAGEPTSGERPTHFVLRSTQFATPDDVQGPTTIAMDWSDGMAKLAVTLIMLDDTALPSQTGEVLIECWARRVEDDASETDGPVSSVTVDVPGNELAAGTARIWETSVTAYRE